MEDNKLTGHPGNEKLKEMLEETKLTEDKTRIPPNPEAFPVMDQNSSYWQPGMTMLDYFAAKAMQGIMSNSDSMKEITKAWRESGIKDDDVYFERFAEVAYSYAKGMLKEREKHLK